MLKVLDLFSGIGGFSLGLERAGMQTVAFCEIEEFPRKVLRKHWPNVPIFEDVRKLKGEDVGPVDVICGGYPCQPFSTAGRRRGEEDDRHLWPEFSRLVAELRPTWVIGENVAGHISMGLDNVLSDLEGQGYACRTFVIPACAVDAPHRRDRCWIIGHADQDSRQQQKAMAINNEAKQHDSINLPLTPDAKRIGRQGPRASRQFVNSKAAKHWQANQFVNVVGWPTEPAICGTNDGVPSGVDRLRALGNAVVPQIPEVIGRAIMASQHA